MRQVSVSEVKEDFAYIMDSAQQEPILVKQHDRNYVAIISMNDYEDLVKIKNLRLKNISADLGTNPLPASEEGAKMYLIRAKTAV